MFWHIDTEIIALLVLLVLYIYIIRNDFSRTLRDRAFRTIVVVTMVVMVIDIISSTIMNLENVNWWIYQISLTLYFIFQPFLAVLWFVYGLIVIYKRLSKKLLTIIIILMLPYLINCIVTLSNPFSSLVFNLDYYTNQYDRGPLYWLMIAVFIFYSIALIILTIIKQNEIESITRRILLILGPIMVTIAIILQLFIPEKYGIGLLIINPTYMIVLIVVYFFARNRELILDPETGALNKHTGEKQIKELIAWNENQVNGSLLVLSIDDFEEMTNTLGASIGTIILQNITNTIKKSVPLNSIIARIDNSEYLVFLRNTIEQEEVLDKIKQINGSIKDKIVFNSQNRPITLSYGIAIYPQHGNNFHELNQNAHKALALAKKLGRQSVYFWE